MKWLKISAVFIVLFAISAFFLKNALLLSDIYKPIITSLFAFFGYYGYTKLGSYTKNKFLFIAGWITLICVILSLFLDMILFSAFPRPIISYATQYLIVSSALHTLVMIPYIFLGVALRKSKDIKFSKAIGILFIGYGLIGAITFFISTIIPFLIILSIFTGWLAYLIFLMITVLSVMMFLNASKQFENSPD